MSIISFRPHTMIEFNKNTFERYEESNPEKLEQNKVNFELPRAISKN